LGLLVGGLRTRLVGRLLLRGDGVLLRLELRPEPGHAPGVVLAFVRDALQVLRALDQLTGPVGRAEQPDHLRAVAVLVEEQRAVAHVVARLRQLLLGRVGLGLEDQPDETESVDLRLGRAQPLVGRVEAGRHIGERCIHVLPCGLGLHQLRARGLGGGAGLADLLLELLLLVGLLALSAPGEGDGREGHEQERGEGPEPTHAEQA
jgi:hypothetical protein